MRHDMPWLAGMCALACFAFTAGCVTDATPPERGSGSTSGGESVAPADAGAAMPDDAADSGGCLEQSRGGIVGPTASFVELCQSGGCSASGGQFFEPSQVALDYGDFPFRGPDGRPVGSYFYAVIAPGYENGGFLDGAPGNLSDEVASSVVGDSGGGDTQADRTIVIAPDQSPAFFPTSHGSHAISFPPSQFMAISLVPFDTSPSHAYVLAICETNATRSCQCAFESFSVIPLPSGNADAGAPPTVDAGAPAVDSGAGGAPCGAVTTGNHGM
jgi:hypothetical protein